MTANLEVDDLVVGILNVPDNVEFVAGKAIGNGEVEVEWIVLEGLLVVDEGEGKTVAGLANELEIYELAETVTWQGVLLVADAINALPQSAYDREEERRLSAPEFLVAIPEIFVTISILDALEFCSMRLNFNGELIVSNLFHSYKCLLFSIILISALLHNLCKDTIYFDKEQESG